MKILLLSHAYNCLCQRLHVELMQAGHEVSVEFDINDAVTCDAVNRFNPELVIAPFLKRAIPERIWQNTLCWIVHPGIIGDRGPSSLDWAIINQEKSWGVTILQANGVMDGGDVWASVEFPLREAVKSSLYRREVTEAAVAAVAQALENHGDIEFKPRPLTALQDEARGQARGQARGRARGKWRPLIRQADRAIDWLRDDTATVIRKIRSADGHPGLLSRLLEQDVYLFNASPGQGLTGEPGEIVARGNGSIAIATRDGAVWVSHLRIKPGSDDDLTLKLPAEQVLSDSLGGRALRCPQVSPPGDIHHIIEGEIAYLHFDFYNGAMSTGQCRQLLAAYQRLAGSPVKAIVLMGGRDFWSNGIHLNVIESCSSPADESWRNINAMNDLCQAIIETTDKLTVAAVNGNAGAGGVFLALACDRVVANDQVVINPHYKSMGNLYGSEYWSYLLPKRVGLEKANNIMQRRLPMGAVEARELGLFDAVYARDTFFASLTESVKETLTDTLFVALVEEKRRRRQGDEEAMPLAHYRDQELARMKLNFYGFDPSYHLARYHFVYKLPKSRTPAFLAKHRVAGFQHCK